MASRFRIIQAEPDTKGYDLTELIKDVINETLYQRDPTILDTAAGEEEIERLQGKVSVTIFGNLFARYRLVEIWGPDCGENGHGTIVRVVSDPDDEEDDDPTEDEE